MKKKKVVDELEVSYESDVVPDVIPELDVPEPVVEPVKDVVTEKKLPKWHRFKQKKEYKKARILELMVDYDEFAKINKDIELSDDDREDYLKELTNLSIEQLSQIGTFQEIKPKAKMFKKQRVKPSYSLTDRWHKIDVKNSIIIRVYHKNKSSTDYLVAKHTRVLTIGNYSYIFPPNAGIFDNKHGKTCYAYYENNPFPIEFGDDFITSDNKGGTFPDAELLKKTLKFEYAQKLAASEMSKKVDTTFIMVIIILILQAAIVLMCVKGFELI